MCAAARSVWRWWVVRGAPKRIRITNSIRGGKESDRSREMSDGLKVKLNQQWGNGLKRRG